MVDRAVVRGRSGVYVWSIWRACMAIGCVCMIDGACVYGRAGVHALYFRCVDIAGRVCMYGKLGVHVLQVG